MRNLKLISILTVILTLVLSACGAIAAEPSATPSPPAPTATAGPDKVFEVTTHSTRLEPVLERLTGVTWEGSYTWTPYVVYHDGVFHLFYNGYSSYTRGVGLAYSEDGTDFTRYENNPILEPSEEEQDNEEVLFSPVVYVEDDGTWVMYIVNDQRRSGLAGDRVMRYTAPAAEGPWEVSNDGEPVYQAPEGHWTEGIIVRSLLVMEDEIWLAFGARYDDTASIGIMRSENGLDFELLSEEPMIVEGGEGEFNQSGSGIPILFETEDGYEMLFLGLFREGVGRYTSWQDDSLWFGYATSSDGVEWELYDYNPVVQIPEEIGYAYASGLKIEDTYWIYYVYNAGGMGIGAASLTISSP